MVGPVGNSKKPARDVNGEPTAGEAAFRAKVDTEFKAKMEEKTLDNFRDVRPGASADPGMQARQAAAEHAPGDAKKIDELLQAMPMSVLQNLR